MLVHRQLKLLQRARGGPSERQLPGAIDRARIGSRFRPKAGNRKVHYCFLILDVSPAFSEFWPSAAARFVQLLPPFRPGLDLPFRRPFAAHQLSERHGFGWAPEQTVGPAARSESPRPRLWAERKRRMKGQFPEPLRRIGDPGRHLHPRLAVWHFNRREKPHGVLARQRNLTGISDRREKRPSFDDLYFRLPNRGRVMQRARGIDERKSAPSLPDVFLAIFHGKHERRAGGAESHSAYLDAIGVVGNRQPSRNDFRFD